MTWSKLFTHANVHRLLVLVLCNMATTIQGALNTHAFQWHALIVGTVAAGFSAALGWFIGNLSSPEPKEGA